jgi:hypothetical protein
MEKCAAGSAALISYLIPRNLGDNIYHNDCWTTRHSWILFTGKLLIMTSQSMTLPYQEAMIYASVHISAFVMGGYSSYKLNPLVVNEWNKSLYKDSRGSVKMCTLQNRNNKNFLHRNRENADGSASFPGQFLLAPLQ